MHKNYFKRGIAMLLTLALAFTMVVPAGAVNAVNGGMSNITFEEIDFTPNFGNEASAKNETASAELPEGPVRVSIVLDGESTLDRGFSTYAIAANANAMAYRDTLAAEQTIVTEAIEDIALGGAELDVVWNMTLTANIISANVDSSKIEAIKAVPGVKDVVVEMRYEPAVIDNNLPLDPNMGTSSSQIGSTVAWAAGYTGAGSKVAIVDTGIDDDHELFQADALEYSYEKQGLDKSMLMTADDVKAVFDKLNISKLFDEKTAEKAADKLYLNSKVPFAFNYVDDDFDINHDKDTQGEHGSHVTGIAAANAYVKKNGEFVPSLEAVATQGVAPDAQVITMKVFGKNGGAYDSDYMVAIEDAIMLGCDSVNLSLGSGSAGFSNNYVYTDILNNLAESDTVVVMSAGNSYSWAEYSNIGGLYSDDINFATGGSPGSYTNTLAVASVDNNGTTGCYVKIGDSLVFYNETSGYGNAPLATMAAGDYDFVYVSAPGTPDDFAQVDVAGKVALCNRGTTSFFQKANAAVAAGAIAVIVVNNQPGVINMNLQGFEGSCPVVSITQADGDLFKTNETGALEDGSPVYTGKVTFAGDKISSSAAEPSADGTYTMSDFSAWGVPGTLEMKPEITAPGGNIYSVNGAIPGGQSYENMSGTSMAAPQVAGMAAVLGQYVRESGLDAKTGYSARQLINSLLMSTAVPVREEDNGGYYYSILKQGSGLANVGAATNADAIIMMADGTNAGAKDGKVKVELGEDAAKTGAYDYSFTITNIADKDNTYQFSTEIFTQAILQQYFLDWATAPVTVTKEVYTVNGKVVNADAPMNADVNKDGLTNAADADAILEYVVGNNNGSAYDLKAADVDGDGEVTSRDAHLILSWFASQVTIKAGETVTVDVHIELDKAALDVYENGAYVEGFTTIIPVSSSEGEMDVTYSIPILGFYGNWSDASMFDNVDFMHYYAYYYGYTDDYTTNGKDFYAGFNTGVIYKSADDNKNYLDVINPWNGGFDEWDWDESRRAIRSVDSIATYDYTLIRNAGAMAAVFRDADGNIIDVTTPASQVYGAYYYVNGGSWQNVNGSYNISKKVSSLGLANGDKFTVELVAAPELYTAPVADDSGAITVNAFKSILDKLGEGSKVSTTYTIDDVVPTLVNASSAWGTGDDDDLLLTMKDDQYIAAAVIYTDNGSRAIAAYKPEQTFKGETVSVVIPADDLSRIWIYNYLYGSGSMSTDFILMVSDYASNTKAYKMNLGNRSCEEVVATAIDIPDEIRVGVGATAEVNITIEPSIIKSVNATWEIADTSVATVVDGVITGLAVGETTITVTGIDNPALKDTAVLKVVETPSDVINGLVYNTNSEAMWSTFNTSNPSAFEEIKQGGYYYAGSIDSTEGVLYTHDGSGVYAVSTEDFSSALQFNINPAYLFPDAAPNYFFEAAIAGEPALVAPKCNTGVIMIFLPTSAGLYTVDLSSHFKRYGGNPCAIAHAGISMEDMTDYYYILLESGALISMSLTIDGDVNLIYVGDTGLDLTGCAAADGSSYASMIYPFTSTDPYKDILYVATYKEGDPTNTAYINIIEVEADATGEIIFCGTLGRFSFGDNVWPAVSLYNPVSTANHEMESAKVIKNKTMPDATATISKFAESAALNPAVNVTGSLNAVSVETDNNGRVIEGIDPAANTYTIRVNAEDAANGKAVVNYDTSMYTIQAVNKKTEHVAYNASKNGEVVVAYASKDNMTGAFAEIVLTYNEANENRLTEDSDVKPVKVTLLEDGENLKVNKSVEIPTPVIVHPHTHRLSGWLAQPQSHWRACVDCGEPTTFGPHIYVGGVCVVCGYAEADFTPVVPNVPDSVENITDDNTVIVETPTEDTDNIEDSEGDDVQVNDGDDNNDVAVVDNPPAPTVDANPTTGLAFAAVPMLLAAAAAAISKRR